MTQKRAVHLVGIGGIGMSGIAQILLQSGYRVSGSDVRANSETDRLKKNGAQIFLGHEAENLGEVDVVVYSSAVAKNNVELLEARRKGFQILSRAEMLAELMRKKRSIVVSGAHGKTTTSAMITTMLLEVGFDPTAVIGGKLKRIAGNAKIGTDDWFVAESDESDGSFLRLLPYIAVITNIDREHLDHYGSYARLEQAFVDFANRVPFDGIVVLCGEDPSARAISEMIERPLLTYGIASTCDVRAIHLELTETGSIFSLERDGKSLGTLELAVPGLHNVLNALACASVGLFLGLPAAGIVKGLAAFHGIDRRLELKGDVEGIRVIDDYAHHPTEILASLEALRRMSKEGRLKVLFQPHRYSRVADHWDAFLAAFDLADEVLVAPIYAASEKPIDGVTGERLATAMKKVSKANVTYVSSIEEGAEELAKGCKKDDVLVTMGAGDITKASGLLMTMLGGRQR